jgi:hypothetical protein
MGYRAGLHLEGRYPRAQLYVPVVRPEQVIWNESVVELRWEAPENLHPSSHLTLWASGVPVGTIWVGHSPRTIRFTLAPLAALFEKRTEPVVPGEPGGIVLELRGFLRISDDPCADLASGALRIWIAPGSRLILAEKPVSQTPSVADFFADLPAHIAVVPFGKHLQELAPTLIGLIGNWEAQFPGTRFVLSTTPPPDSLPQIWIGVGPPPRDLSDHPPQTPAYLTLRGRKLIFWAQNGQALQQAAWALVAPELRQTLRDPGIRLIEARELKTSAPTRAPVQLTFEELGWKDLIFSGSGVLRQTVYFSPADRGFFARSMELVLRGRYTPLDSGEKGFLNVYWNERLLYSRKLDRSGTWEEVHIPIAPVSAMEPGKLDFELLFYPQDGGCQGSGRPFLGHILPDSYVRIPDPTPPDRLTLGMLPGLLLPELDIGLLPPIEPEQIQAAALLVRWAARQSGLPRWPTVRFEVPPEGGAILARASAIPRPLLERFPVRPDQELTLIREDGSVLFAASLQQITGMVVLGGTGRAPLLGVISRGEGGYALASRLLERIPASRLLRGANLAFTDGRLAYGLHTEGPYRIWIPDRPGIGYYVRKYRLLLFILVWVLVLFGLFWIYERLRQNQSSKVLRQAA